MEQILNHRLGDVAQNSPTADEGIATEDSNGYRSKKRKLFVYLNVLRIGVKKSKTKLYYSLITHYVSFRWKGAEYCKSL